MRRVPAVVENHIRLPALGGYTLVDAPPEILLGLGAPRVHRVPRVRQGGCHLVLRGVDVASGPSYLSAELYQRLD